MSDRSRLLEPIGRPRPKRRLAGLCAALAATAVGLPVHRVAAAPAVPPPVAAPPVTAPPAPAPAVASPPAAAPAAPPAAPSAKAPAPAPVSPAPTVLPQYAGLA